MDNIPSLDDGLVIELIDFEGVFVAASRAVHANGVARHFRHWKRPVTYKRPLPKQ